MQDQRPVIAPNFPGLMNQRHLADQQAAASAGEPRALRPVVAAPLHLIRPLSGIEPEQAREIERAFSGIVTYRKANEHLRERKHAWQRQLDSSGKALQQRDLSPSERRHLWENLFYDETLSLEDLLPYRMCTAWRLVRAFALLCGHVHEDESLARVCGPRAPIEKDPWVTPQSLLPGVSRGEFSAWHAIDLIIGNPPNVPCIPLLPPAPPQDAGDDYDAADPAQDPMLARYIEALSCLAAFMDLGAGTTAEPACGRWGLAGLEDPYLVRLAFPTRTELCGFEDMIVDETLRMMMTGGMMSVNTHLTDRYGLGGFECACVIKLAKARANKRVEAPLEDEKAMMILRLEDYIDRARNGMDRRNELAGLKMLSQVLGLTRAEPENQLKEYVEVVARGSREAEMSPPPRQISAGPARPATNGAVGVVEVTVHPVELNSDGY
jgi:hypothetical protein